MKLYAIQLIFSNSFATKPKLHYLLAENKKEAIQRQIELCYLQEEELVLGEYKVIFKKAIEIPKKALDKVEEPSKSDKAYIINYWNLKVEEINYKPKPVYYSKEEAEEALTKLQEGIKELTPDDFCPNYPVKELLEVEKVIRDFKRKFCNEGNPY